MDNRTDFPEDRFSVYEHIVKNCFAFLVEDYGFELSSIERVANSYIALKYLSEKVFVKLYYGSPEFELDFYIGRLGIEDKSEKDGFTSNDLLCLSDDVRWVDYKLYSAYSFENLRTCLPKLAELMKVCGANCLNGESSAYENVLFEKKRSNNQWGKEQELKQAKRAASDAWKNKDYIKFIEVFEPVANELSVLEKKKLDYARKQL